MLIKTDLRRVLDRMQIQYRELKAGFECIHLPSIDVSSVQPVPVPGHHPTSSGSDPPPRTSIVKKASKLSFGIKRDKGKDREKEKEDKDKELPNRPSTAGGAPVSSRSGSSSFFNVSSNHTAPAPTEGGGEVNGVLPEEGEPQNPVTPVPGKTLPPIPTPVPSPMSPSVPAGNAPSAPMTTGEVDREVFENLESNTLSVKFEITIVKVSGGVLSLAWIVLMGGGTGTMVAFAWDPVSTSERGWMAIPNVGPTCANGTQVVRTRVSLSSGLIFFSLTLFSLRSSSLAL